MRLQLRAKSTGAIILDVGGRWDRKEKEYVGPAASARIVYAHDGQLVGAYWFAEWLGHFVRGDFPPDVARAYSWTMFGGRRRGKSWLAALATCAFSIAVAGSYPWYIVPVEDDDVEIVRYLRRFLHPDWYTFTEEDGGFRLVNGSTLERKSAHKPEGLRRGECSFAFLNEGQKTAKAAYEILRGAAADTGSLVMMCANPPKLPIGYWLYEHVAKARAGQIDGVIHDFTENPEIDMAALTSLAKEMGARDYRIDIGGELLKRDDVVFYAMSDDNVRPTPEVGDVTEGFLKKHVGRPFQQWIELDFQRKPHMVAFVNRAFVAPGCPCGQPHPWTTEEIILENADEDDMIVTLARRHGLTGENSVAIGDASGDWQGVDRIKGRSSFDRFRRAGWLILKPDEDLEKNPDVMERAAVGNARLCTYDGNRHAFVDPKCWQLIEALKKWDTKYWRPNSRSVFAHRCDAWSYGKHRFFAPLFRAAQQVAYESIAQVARIGEMKGWSGEQEDEDD